VLPNPYSPGETPRFLAGRTEQLAEIAQQTTRILQTGGMGGPLLVFTAPRGVGKTSLLRAAQQ
jgi:hypothetical protein